VVQLNATVKQLCSIVAKLDTLKHDILQESA
jgi:hypothetical protein